MRFRNTLRNRFCVAVLVCCFLFFVVTRSLLIAADVFLKPLENPDRLPATIAVKLARIFLYVLMTAVTVPWLYRKIWPETKENT